MRISDVLATLRVEFPTISHSKLRFLEEQGLVDPGRTTAGYRHYSVADVERLRFVLMQQRDRYLPLKVIKETLAALDSGELEAPPGPRPAPGAGESDGGRAPYQSAAELAADAGVDPKLVVELVRGGALTERPEGFGAHARDVVVVAAALAEYGIEPRHLRSLRAAADRQVHLVDTMVAPLRSQANAAARGRAASVGAEIGELLARLHTAWIREGLIDLNT